MRAPRATAIRRRTELLAVILDYACHSVATLLNADWLSSRKCHGKVEIFQLEQICRPIRVSTFTLYGIVSPLRVWCERTLSPDILLMGCTREHILAHAP